MAKHCRTVVNVLLAALVACAACASDRGEPAKGQGKAGPPEPPEKQQRPTFAETSKATLTHKGKTLEFQSAVAIARADSKLVEVYFFPYPLTDAQKAALLEGHTPLFR